MAEAGSTAERVKQQADIVRVVGEYVRLKKTGKDFSGLCPFHQEKTPSFTVSPIKQIFYCFGCGKGGDIFNFVMEMERCDFPDALRVVAEKCGISIPIANEGGKIVAFGCRALGDDQPKYLNSPETLIYSKSNVLYHLDRAKEALRRSDFAVLVEGYMDAIAVARAGISNVVASCGTSLAEPQIKLLGRFTKRVIVNYDPDTAGQAATERSLSALLEQDFEVRVLALPAIGDKKADPDLFIREKGSDAYQKQLRDAPAFIDYLATRARTMDLSTAEAKQKALNYLLPYLQKIPNKMIRTEWAKKAAIILKIDEPVLR